MNVKTIFTLSIMILFSFILSACSINFSGTYSVSGRTTDASGKNLSGVIVYFSGSINGKTVSDANGQWTITGLKGQNTIYPQKDGYEFSPPNLTVSKKTTRIVFAGHITQNFGVVIGDSIAEGHPGLHGRLHPNSSIFDEDYEDQSGQLSYEFVKYTGLKWYNHGIGSQTSTQVWQRWQRDALAMEYDPGDGRGAKTLLAKPKYIYVHCGVNDLYQMELQNALVVIKGNLENMARSAQDNQVIAIFGTIGPHNLTTPEKIQATLEINQWMKTELPKYGAYVVDFYEWGVDPIRPGKVDSTKFIDDVHPSKNGYVNYASYVFQQLPHMFN